MIAIIKTNNPVTLSYAQSVLRDCDIHFFVADIHASFMEGPVGAMVKRLMVIEEDVGDAHEALIEAGLEKELQPV